MSGLTTLIAFHCALLAADAGYPAALAEAQAKNRPLLVLVGADWCPGCRTMKNSVLPSLARRGALRGVSFAGVDADSEPQTAQQLMRGSSIPQLIVFSRKADGTWHREQIIGETSEGNVQSMIARALQVRQVAPVETSAEIGN